MDVLRRGWRMNGAGALKWVEDQLPPPAPGRVTVEVIGCGVCHTDLSYLYGGVPTVAKQPILGHEIVGRVIDSTVASDVGRTVIVPAVSPCGECPACRRGRRTACKHGLMPGNHHDGGFATHVQVPGRFLCDVPPLPDGLELWQLAAVADAVTTPWQAIKRARLERDEIAIVVGAGGVGGFLVELARSIGAFVAALDVDPARLERMQKKGAFFTLDVSGHDAKEVKSLIARALPPGHALEGCKVFECSGVPAGQQLAWSLLTRGGTLSIVGFSPEALPIKLSNLMALDAEAYGNWGCDPDLVPSALEQVLIGAVHLASAVERHPLSAAPDVLAAVNRHELSRRAVLVPDV